MPAFELRRVLDDPAHAETWLAEVGLDDPDRARRNLEQLAGLGLPEELLLDLLAQLADHLPQSSDADRALNNLERFVAAARSPLSLLSLFERDRGALPVLLQIFATSQHLSDLLVADSEAYDLLMLTEGQPVARDLLVAEFAAEVAALSDERQVLVALRRHKRRETLRIVYGDLVRELPLESTAAQISYLADAMIEAAVSYARRRLVASRGQPRRSDGTPARFVVLGLGKLGGTELNYSSDVDLVFLYDEDGQTDGPRQQTNAEFFARLAGDVVRLLSDVTEWGHVYRVDLRLRPEGSQGPPVMSLEAAQHYYDVSGRTWERQAYVKARAVAGDLSLGSEFLGRLEPWIYRRYLSLADISGIKALKRRIEQRTQREGGDQRDVKTGHGGLRDIEFVIQFLQLLNGGDLPAVRCGSTLEAISRLETVGCLTHQERSLLEENYRFLRRIEHLLQIMFDLQTHALPNDRRELARLARRLGYRDRGEPTALAQFESDFQTRTDLNRRMLDHLLHDAFPADSAEPEVDLVLDPDPPRQRIAEVLGRYPFRDVDAAYRHLSALANERIRFLSSRRCRHFLAAIAPRLLEAIAATPDPDSTLVQLEKVSDSLGGKGVLWELFSFNPPTLQLYVELCATSPFLTGLLESHPAMIDELMDSLVLNKLPTHEFLARSLDELCRAAEDIEPILHRFRDAQLLRVGVRDILRKEPLETITDSLTEIAQVCLDQIVDREFEKLCLKLGEPRHGEGPREGQPCELVILALGKFGGRELNYHSDLDLVFLYEADGSTVFPLRMRRGEPTTNQHFFGELGQRVIRVAGQLSPVGRLYQIDPRLRPTGRSGALATNFAEFERYFRDGDAQLWERQALCKARVVYGSVEAARDCEAIVQALLELPPAPNDVRLIRQMRARLEEGAAPGNLKRGRGGLVDVEFLVQMLQLRHGAEFPQIRSPNTLRALAALTSAGLLSAADGDFFLEAYRFLRTLEGRLRLMSTTARDTLPDDPRELDNLARQLGYPSRQTLVETCSRTMQRIRERYDALVPNDAID